MGWFDEQIKEKEELEKENFADAMEELSSVIMGREAKIRGDKETVQRRSRETALQQIFHYYHLKTKKVPGGIVDLEDQMEFFCRPHGVMRRNVVLEKGWYENAIGVYLGFKKDGTTIALLPDPVKGYSYFEAETGEKVKINAKTAAAIEAEAICFYKPFPMRKLKIRDLVRYASECIPKITMMQVVLLMAILTAMGMLVPRVTYYLFEYIIPLRNERALFATAVFMIYLSLSRWLLEIAKTVIDGTVGTRIGVNVQAAAMARILTLPATFFKKYSSGELTTKIQAFHSLSEALYSTIFVTILNVLFSLVYITQVFKYANALFWPALLITVLTMAVSIASTNVRAKAKYRAMEASGKKNGFLYEILTGIQKIKIAGAEKRAFVKWSKLYTVEVKNTYGIPMFGLLGENISIAISLVGMILFYFLAVKEGVPVSEYYTFTSLYAILTSSITSLTELGKHMANIRPTLEMIRPILDEVPEVSEEKKVVRNLAGSIELNHISFRYDDSMPWVLDDFSLDISDGQYVAIVGKTGCGKSTLMRLLLGFEVAQRGNIFYDKYNLDELDLRSLRKQIGVVMQNGKLFHGDIFSNITISAPWLTLDDAWNAAEMADVADDIRAMPMGMHTVISEGSGGLSGGQKQRLMIARAVAPNPKILMFDEATSALDNITQKKVSQALDQLQCTRIVIAHRLSTIRHCDRIIVLDEGKIAEDGTYEELMKKNGRFAELVNRQMII